jgi:hypothetical protein
LLFGHKNKPQTKLRVDLGDLKKEREHLSDFLHSKLKVTVVPAENKLDVSSEKLSGQELQRMVTKFVYHRHYNNAHWVSLEGATVKINRFKGTDKKKEKHKKKDTAQHQTPTQSWGL